ncbi:hypothetical protein [Natrarchaeobaculum sulfurireducens]|uniref:Uncharacterized protein n=1 Tax=Natrarchaeobaculum sulfurireducens TaxID=2044521 RepID=A0A346PK50_9EURY|nr:hypothetical protein [Natrarchaeobaculum sulfurireducens]AXR79895.1 hypothetical protein AArcMg_4070 [Natrarchaeobaculum sulfurireducens]
MTERFHVQWTPHDGPPQRIIFEPADEDRNEDNDKDVDEDKNRDKEDEEDEDEVWHRITELWDGKTWSRTNFEVVEDPSVYAPAPPRDIETEQTPPTLEELLEETQMTWRRNKQKALVFNQPTGPLVVASPYTYPRCNSDQLATNQPISMKQLQMLVRQVGLPSVESLEEMRFSTRDFLRGDFNA